MIPVPSGVRVWLAVGYTDMRRGMNSLALQVQEVLKRDPHAGDLYVFRGRRGHLIKILWHGGIGICIIDYFIFPFTGFLVPCPCRLKVGATIVSEPR